MKMKIFSILTFFSLIAIFGCKKECPAFDPAFLPWISFLRSDSLVYTNPEGDSVFFVTGIQNASVAYPIEKDVSCPCYSYANFITESDGVNSYMDLNIAKSNIDIKVNATILFYYHGYIHKNTNIVGYFNDFDRAAAPVTINGTTFDEALIIENDTTISFTPREDPGQIYKVIIVKDHGVMQFYDKTGVWTLVE